MDTIGKRVRRIGKTMDVAIGDGMAVDREWEYHHHFFLPYPPRSASPSPSPSPSPPPPPPHVQLWSPGFCPENGSLGLGTPREDDAVHWHRDDSDCLDRADDSSSDHGYGYSYGYNYDGGGGNEFSEDVVAGPRGGNVSQWQDLETGTEPQSPNIDALDVNDIPIARKKSVTFAPSPSSSPLPCLSPCNRSDAVTTTTTPPPPKIPTSRRESRPLSPAGRCTPPTPTPSPPTPPPHKTLALFPPALPYTLPRDAVSSSISSPGISGPALPHSSNSIVPFSTTCKPSPSSSFRSSKQHISREQDQHQHQITLAQTPPPGYTTTTIINPNVQQPTENLKPPTSTRGPWAKRRTVPKPTYMLWAFGVRIPGRVMGPRGPRTQRIQD
ncbi:uncharacterized protein EI97DRAFT_443650 [Westerdykella ornata]|uniref:Uncharacterized protein n=1 Tax=Westerdykella ornata TaxID=318751 RepID=A0A6A6JFI9_WESOR|nr:uncharacterized protein EI97DRAFT_443650 [Westerdykella ornata]KAF2275097.1 hypothetical protein EI97DRAFT_443650 [Westerdykella ornata]